MATPEFTTKLELAAQVLMAPPNQVSVQDRKDAEYFFLNLREGLLSVDSCRQILETTQNQFLMFELARVLIARILKEWSKFSLEDVRGICAYLLNFPVNHPNLPNFVATEMFHSAAMIVKRSSLPNTELLTDLIGTLETFLSNENQKMQAYGLQIIELVATEFSTAWRSSNISISWDFHLKAKKQFEDVLLKQLMQLSLRVLSKLVTSSDLSSQLDQQVCDKFLRVASLIFCWNFSPKYLYLHFKILISALRSNTFRPPETWHDLFGDTSIIVFFMQLHSRVRFNEQLCQNSMVCLTQLASLIGDALGPSGPILLVLPQIGDIGERRLATSMGGELEKGTAGDKKQLLLHDHYVQTFSRHLIELFSDLVLDHEMPHLSLVLYKLLTCHPIALFARFPPELLLRLVQFIVANLLKLIQPAMALALKNDQTYHTALTDLFQVWRAIIRAGYIESSKEISQESLNRQVIDTFLKSVLSPPFGTRTKPSSEEIFDENEEEEDDRTVFMDLLCDIGYFSLHSIDFFVDYISQAMVQRLAELRALDLASISREQMQTWQEDFHWLLLLTGYFIRQPSYRNIGNFPEELAVKCLNGFQSGEYAKVEDFEPLFASCLDNPPFDPANYPARLDPVTLISTQVLSWFCMEHQMLLRLDSGAPLLSPTLSQTSLWQFSLLMIVLTPSMGQNESSFVSGQEDADEEGEEAEEDKMNGQWRENIKFLPSIAPKSALSARIIQMSLEKMFTILTKMSGEKRLCTDVIEMLINFAEYRSEELATNEHLYSLLAGLNIENLPSRRPLVKSLVLIGAIVESEEIRLRMHSTILEPMMQRFLALCEKRTSANDSQLADYFECFTGVADAGQADTAQPLFRYLQPVFERCVPLIRAKPDAQLLLVSVLEFLKSSTDVLFFYVESQEDTLAYHQLLIGVTNAYKDTQLQRFSSLLASGDEEQQHQDLSALIEILCLSISKTYMPQVESTDGALVSAKVSLHGLETLLPLMSEELLKIPRLCASFFRLLIFVSDIAPSALVQVGDQMLAGFLGCVQMALDNIFGMERVRSALEIITNLAAFCHGEVQKGRPVSQFLVQNVLKLIPKVFELAMQFSCEVEVFNEATGSLFSLINLDQAAFSAYIGQLLALPANAEAKALLEQAFTKLLSADEDGPTPWVYTASKKRQFQNRFQHFLVQVSGALCLI